MYTSTVNAPEMRCIVLKWNLDPGLCGVVVSMYARQNVHGQHDKREGL